MRFAFSFFLFFFVILSGTGLGDGLCSFDGGQPTKSSEISNRSSFRGISLAGTPQEVRQAVKALGFEPDILLYVGSENLVSGVNIYRAWEQIGTVSFDRRGRIPRLSLNDKFFCAKPIFVRRFVEQLFEHYGVEPIKEADDVCFQDVTCFKGVSKHGEHFLILRIGTTAELYVRP
jgi:hypothetical protein